MDGSIDNNAKSQELIREGLRAYARGNFQQAHDVWRQAATLTPHNEQVWLLLLSILKDKDDRRVCLENIVAINPDNQQAQQQLQLLQAQQPAAHHRDTAETGILSGMVWRLRLVLRPMVRMALVLLTLLLLFILGILAGVSLQLIPL